MKLGIGTAQFGFDYGISNEKGKTPLSEIISILKIASESGINFIDTASAYGESEEALGRALPERHSFKIITKTEPLASNTITVDSGEKIKSNFYRSLEKMKQEKIYALLLHHGDELFLSGGSILWDAMVDLKGEGLVEKIGASVYDPIETKTLIEQFALDIAQLPLSAFDRRMQSSGMLSELNRRGVEIHARSIFLQGLMFMAPGSLNDYFAPIKGLIQGYRDYCDSFGISAMDGAIAYIKSVKEVECAVVGLNDSSQLLENLESFKKEYSEEFLLGLDKFTISDPKFVNPSMWRLK